MVFFISLITALSAIIGYSVFSHLSVQITAVTLSIAAGGILAMLVDTMIPEAFSKNT